MKKNWTNEIIWHWGGLQKSKYERFHLLDFLKNPYLLLQKPCHFRSWLETSALMHTPVHVHAGGECAPRLFQDVKYVDIPVPWFSLWVWSIGLVALGRISLLCNLQLTDMFCAKSIDIAKWGHFGFPPQTDRQTPQKEPVKTGMEAGVQTWTEST